MPKSLCKAIIIGLSSTILAYSSAVFPSAGQILTIFNYQNAAELGLLKKGQIVLGNTYVNLEYRFDGATTNALSGFTGNGKTNSHVQDFLPYFRFAARLNDIMVAGLDITQPNYSNIDYPNDSIVRFQGTKTLLRTTDISPKLSIQLSDALQVGLGANAQMVSDGRLDFAVPTLGIMNNTATGWGYGWNVGLFYTITEGTYLSAAYFSKITAKLSGTSTIAGVGASNATTDLVFPGLATLQLIQYFSEDWLASVKLFYAQWSAFQNLVINNTVVGTVTIPLDYKDTWGIEVGTRKELNDTLAVLFGFTFDQTPEPLSTRNISVTSGSTYAFAGALAFKLTENAEVQVGYEYNYVKENINNTLDSNNTIAGRLRGDAHVIDVRLVMDFV
jgi:long-chain fatty acid transport protein